MILGFAGRAGAGKDVAARVLEREYGYTILRFSDPIKRLLNERFGWTMGNWDNREWKETRREEYGGYSPREWAQWLGTDVGRALSRDAWINRMSATMWNPYNSRTVIPDVRFHNEVQWILDQGGKVYLIERRGLAESCHASETQDLPIPVDRILINNGTEEQFRALVRWQMAKDGVTPLPAL